MKLTEVHSSRIESIINDAIRATLDKHKCRSCDCCDCDFDDDDDEGGDGIVAINDFDRRAFRQHLLLALKKLEAELVNT
jgi:hypothetical protein